MPVEGPDRDRLLGGLLGWLIGRLCRALGLAYVEDWYGDPDHRSYQVSFKKIRDRLDYKTSCTPESGAQEIYTALEIGALKDGPTTRTVDWYKSLIQWHDMLKSVVQHDVVL